jgi:hypothetical protein
MRKRTGQDLRREPSLSPVVTRRFAHRIRPATGLETVKGFEK